MAPPLALRLAAIVVIVVVTGSAAVGEAAALLSSAERGRMVATRSGCLSCHGPQLTGKAILSDPSIATLYASNLTRAAPRYSDRELERTIRTAVRPDGSHLWMMAAPYEHLTPADMHDLLSFIRSLPPRGDDHGRIRMGPRFIKAVKAGRLQPEAIEQARDTVAPPDFGPRFAQGHYLARTICAGCHYPSLNGQPDPQLGDAPNLSVVAGYTRDQFRTLIRTGVALGDRKVGVMTEESPKRFNVLSDAEIDAIHDYLAERARLLR